MERKWRCQIVHHGCIYLWDLWFSGFQLLRFVIGQKISRHFLDQSEVKPKPNVTCSHAFSRAWRRSHIFASRSDWFIGLSASVVIGQSNYFGFGFTTLSWKPLYNAFNWLCKYKLEENAVSYREESPVKDIQCLQDRTFSNNFPLICEPKTIKKVIKTCDSVL